MTTEIVIDVGGEGNAQHRFGATCTAESHPYWKSATWFSVNISSEKVPDIVADAVTLSGIKDESVDGVYSSHTIEHVAPSQSYEMFRNWLRVLRPGGRLEIRCPDVEWTWREKLAGRLPESIVTELVMGIRVGPYESHRNIWWESKLLAELSETGFVNARRINYGFQRPLLDFWYYDGSHSEHRGYKVIDLVVEAYKTVDLEGSEPRKRGGDMPRFGLSLVSKTRSLYAHLPASVRGLIRKTTCFVRAQRQARLLQLITLPEESSTNGA